MQRPNQPQSRRQKPALAGARGNLQFLYSLSRRLHAGAGRLLPLSMRYAGDCCMHMHPDKQGATKRDIELSALAAHGRYLAGRHRYHPCT